MTSLSCAQETKLNVMVFRGGQNCPLFAAQMKGFLAKRGLLVDVQFAPSAEALAPGLASGRLQIIHSTSDNAVKIADVDKLDVALVVGGDNAHNHIIAQQDIQSLADLRGKTIVLDTSTSGYAYVLYAILKRNGLNKGDYILKTVGATPRRLEAMLNDKGNKAAVLNPPFSIQAVKGGLKDMGSTVALTGPYQGPAATRCGPGPAPTAIRWSSICRPISRACAGRSIRRTKTRQPRSSPTGSACSPDIAAAVYAVIADKNDGFARDGKFDLEGFMNVLNLRAEYEGGTPAASEKYLDLSYYQRALAGL